MSDIDLNLLPDFIVETAEHLEELEGFLLRLNDTPKDLKLLNEIFRPVHTIKGSAQFIGVVLVAKLAHKMEDLLDLLRDGRKQCTEEMIAVFMQSKDRVTQLVLELDQMQAEVSSIDDLVDALG